MNKKNKSISKYNSLRTMNNQQQSKKIVKYIIPWIIIGSLIFLGIELLALVPLQVRSFGFLFLLLLSFAISASILAVINRSLKWIATMATLHVSAFVLLLLVTFFTTSSMFHASSYRQLIGTVETNEFSKDVSAVDLSKLPIVDLAYANRLADKKLGDIPALGSQAHVGELTLQQIQGELFYVAPLVHNGFFQWLNNQEGTTGYIKVSATNPNDVELVTEVAGSAIQLKYQKEAFFGTDLKRYVQLANPNIFLTDYSFEVDESGHPYWVITTYNKTIGFSGNIVNGVIIVDPKTGDMTNYSMNEVPSWVDRVIPFDFGMTYLNDWGKFVHGFWNSVFSQKEMLMQTEGAATIYSDGNCYYYTGITSVGKDESTVGFMLINTKTAQATFYKVSGATETAAMGSAEGKVQNLGYTSTFPILINVQKEPTYYTTLKDRSGLVKMFAFVNVKNYNVVGAGETLESALEQYQTALSEKLNVDLTGKDLKEIKGTIERIGMSFNGKESVYHVYLVEDHSKVFIVNENISPEIALTRENDQVVLKYFDLPNLTEIPVKEFDNTLLELK